MLELSKRTRGIAATGMAAGALIVGANAEAKTSKSPTSSGANVELTSDFPEQRISIDQLTEQTAKGLKESTDVNYYNGTVTIKDKKTGKIKFAIKNPFVIYRYGATPDKQQFSVDHPRSKYWAIGYVQKGIEGNLGHDNVVLLPFNSNDNNFVFAKQPHKVAPEGIDVTVDVVKFPRDAAGNIDWTKPMNHEGKAQLADEVHPLSIAQGFNQQV